MQQALPPEVRKIRSVRAKRETAEKRAEERRLKPRVNIHDLNKEGIAALQKAGISPEQLRDPDPRSGFEKGLDWLDVGRNTVAQVIASLTGLDKEKIKTRGTFGQKKIWMADVLEHLGVKNKAVRAIGGFIGDVAIDPLTYLTKGATMGLKIARHLPPMRPAAVKTLRGFVKGTVAASALDPNLAKALGGASRLEKFQRAARVGGRAGRMAATPEARAKAIKNFQKKFMSKSGGRLTRTLAREATTGTGARRAAAQATLKKSLYKGRQLLGIPFTDISGPTLKFGKKARLYKALEKVKGFKYQGKIRKLIGDIQQVNTLQANARKAYEAGDFVQGVRLAKQHKALKKSVMGQARVFKLGGQAGPKQMTNLLEQAKNLMQKSKYSSLAPAIQQERNISIYGKRAVSKWGQGAQDWFGTGKSPFRSRELGVADRFTFGRSREYNKAMAQWTPVADNLANNLVRDGFAGSVDEAYTLMNNALEVGDSAGMNLLHASDPNRAISGKLAQVFARPDYQEFSAAWRKATDAAEAIEKAGGLKYHSMANYVPHILSREARPFVSKQLHDAGVAQLLKAQIGGGVGGLFKSPFTLKRNRLVELMDKSGNVRRQFVTSSVADIDKFKKANRGWRQLFEVADLKGNVIAGSERMHNAKTLAAQQAAMKGGKYQLVPKQWNPTMEWYNQGVREGTFGATILGNEGVAAKLPRLFENNPAKIMAARMAQHEQAMAVVDFRKTVGQYAVKVDIAQARNLESLGLRIPKPIGDDHPLAWLKQGIYPTKGGAGPIAEAFPIPVADGMDRLADLFKGGKETNALLHFSDMTLAWFKRWALFHPAYPLRNVVDNGVGIIVAGGNVVKSGRYAFFNKAAAKLAKAIDLNNLDELGDLTMPLAGRNHKLRALAEEAMANNYRGAGHTAAQIAPAALQGTGVGAVVGQKVDKGLRAGLDSIRRVNTWFESKMRLGTWLSFIDDGMSSRDAAMRTLLAMPDLADITKMERQFMTRIFPWYRWAKNNGARQLLHFLPQKPAFMASVGKFQHLVEAFDERVPNELRPKWMREAQATQFAGDEKEGSAFMLRSWLPFEEVQQLMAGLAEPAQTARWIAGSARPGIKGVAEMATGQDIFRQRPVQPFSLAEAVGLAPKALMGASGTPLDNLLAIRPIREYGRRVWEQPTALGKVTRGIAGGAVQPLSAERGLREIDLKTAGDIAQLRRKIVRAKENQDAVELQSLLVQLMRLQVQRRRHGLTVPKDTERVLAGVQ